MKITRHGHFKNRGTTTLLDHRPEVSLTDSGVELWVSRVHDPLDPTHKTVHDYTVELSREDMLQIVGELLDPQARADPLGLADE